MTDSNKHYKGIKCKLSQTDSQFDQNSPECSLPTQPVLDIENDQNSPECLLPAHSIMDSENDLSSQECLLLTQPVFDNENDKNSPECLLPMQPVLDSENDQNSPECLLLTQPVGDCYSSDESFIKTKHTKDTTKSASKELPSKLTGPEVLFYYDLDYKSQPQGRVDLTLSMPAVQILEHIFTFIGHHEGRTCHYSSDCGHITKHGQTCQQLRNSCMIEGGPNHRNSPQLVNDLKAGNKQSIAFEGISCCSSINECGQFTKHTKNPKPLLKDLKKGGNDKNIPFERNSSSCINPSKFKKDGKTMQEILNHHLKNKWLSWLAENDVLNFKTCSLDDWRQKDIEYSRLVYGEENGGKTRSSTDIPVKTGSLDDMEENSGEHVTSGDLRDIRSVYELLVLIRDNYEGNGCSDPGRIREIFRIIQEVMPLTSNLRYGSAVYQLLLTPPESSQLTGPPCVITLKPDAVFAKRDPYNRSATGRVLCQVYSDSRQEYSAHVSEDKATMNTKQPPNRQPPTTPLLSKPVRTADGPLSASYRKAAFAYFTQSVPVDCRGCVGELTGSHVLQLIALAQELKDNVMNYSNAPVEHYTPIGLFVKREYVYFTKLEINRAKLRSFTPAGFVDIGKSMKGSVSYSPWRLDLSCPSHRLALFTALLELL